MIPLGKQKKNKDFNNDADDAKTSMSYSFIWTSFNQSQRIMNIYMTHEQKVCTVGEKKKDQSWPCSDISLYNWGFAASSYSLSWEIKAHSAVQGSLLIYR